MKVINQLLDYSRPWNVPDVYLFTGNNTIKENGAIVMGRGAAKQVRNAYPGIDKKFGDRIQKYPNVHVQFIRLPKRSDVKTLLPQIIGWFQVKYHWKQSADPYLIKKAAHDLESYAKQYPHHVFHMNYPGIGNGSLTVRDVQPIIEFLPDNVLIYQ